jgi:hypothetical protein
VLLLHVELENAVAGLTAFPLPKLYFTLNALALQLDQFDSGQIVSDEKTLLKFPDRFGLESDRNSDRPPGAKNKSFCIGRKCDSISRFEIVADSRNRIWSGRVEDGHDSKGFDGRIGERCSVVIRLTFYSEKNKFD